MGVRAPRALAGHGAMGSSCCRRAPAHSFAAMHSLLVILGIAGFLAVARHALDALLRLLHGDVAAALAGGRASARAQHGDLTGLQEAEAERRAAAGRRRIGLALLVLWTALLLLPPLTPWPGALYAAYALLWLLPRRRPRA